MATRQCAQKLPYFFNQTGGLNNAFAPPRDPHPLSLILPLFFSVAGDRTISSSPLPMGLEKKIGKAGRPGSGDGRDGGAAGSGRPNLYGRGGRWRGRQRRGAREGEEDEGARRRGREDIRILPERVTGRAILASYIF